MASLKEFGSAAAAATMLTFSPLAADKADAATVTFSGDIQVNSSTVGGVNVGDLGSFALNYDDTVPTDIIPTPNVAFYNIPSLTGSGVSINGTTLTLGNGGFQVVNDLPNDDIAGFFDLSGQSLFGQALGGINFNTDGGPNVFNSENLSEALTNAGNFPTFTFNVLADDNFTSLFSGAVRGTSYEVDNGTMSAVPLPMGGLLLFTALGGLGIARRLSGGDAPSAIPA